MSEGNSIEDDEILDEYSLEGAVRGKYADRFPRFSKLVLLDPDVAAHFPDSASVNHTLRALVDSRSGSGPSIEQQSRRLTDPAFDAAPTGKRITPSRSPVRTGPSMRAPESHRWTLTDDAAALYVQKYGHTRIAGSITEVANLLDIKAGSFRMRVGNFKALAGDGGLGNFARQSRDVYERYGSLSEPELRAVAFPDLPR